MPHAALVGFAIVFWGVEWVIGGKKRSKRDTGHLNITSDKVANIKSL
jgi:hypothetical protein